ncbi:hypothetical protein PR048_028468 [Dryococelus australis]|uniref:PiggyBac transposable element-derived protein domain-containing protein n=1 Tax=Dryococelus australis TaxID=614101 RepID=A0ABQ9GBC9_9NEOP|nr:hypothetical protein PR048_028468 [Dryococelus australis]
MARRTLTLEQPLQYFQELSEIESEGRELLDTDDDYVPQNSDSTGSEDIDEPGDIISKETSVVAANVPGDVPGKPEHVEQDKFAVLSDIWNQFISNCISSYKPRAHVTVDEQHFPTKAKCRFTQCMSSKPDKFGIKFWLAVDLGKDEKRPSDHSLSENVVLRLVDPYLVTDRNITME